MPIIHSTSETVTYGFTMPRHLYDLLVDQAAQRGVSVEAYICAVLGQNVARCFPARSPHGVV